MRHKVFGNHLGRNTNSAKALYRSLSRELLLRGRIETTLPKAKTIVALVDKLIKLGKQNSLNARRQVIKILGGDNIINTLFKEVAPKYMGRNSGYTRIIKMGQRISDSTEMAIIELVEGSVASESTPKLLPENKPEAKDKKAKKVVVKKTKQSKTK